MTRDDIIQMAREAGLGAALTHNNSEPRIFIEGADWHDEIERFAALVVAHEREECAKVCEAQENRVVMRHPARVEFDPNSMMARTCAVMIRARNYYDEVKND